MYLHLNVSIFTFREKIRSLFPYMCKCLLFTHEKLHLKGGFADFALCTKEIKITLLEKFALRTIFLSIAFIYPSFKEWYSLPQHHSKYIVTKYSDSTSVESD